MRLGYPIFRAAAGPLYEGEESNPSLPVNKTGCGHQPRPSHEQLITVPRQGLEPRTFGLKDRCSAIELARRSRSRIRTYGARVNSPSFCH